MQQDFVRCRAGIERADPDFDKNPQTVLGGMERNMAGSAKAEGVERAAREAHAKGKGLTGAKWKSSKGCRIPTRKGSTPSRDATRQWRASRTGSGMSGQINFWARAAA